LSTLDRIGSIGQTIVERSSPCFRLGSPDPIVGIAPVAKGRRRFGYREIKAALSWKGGPVLCYQRPELRNLGTSGVDSAREIRARELDADLDSFWTAKKQSKLQRKIN
jgi:hypothetical protein